MPRKALVEINVSDTDELRLQKINRNFQLVFRRLLSQGTSSSQLTRQSATGNTASSVEGMPSDELGEYLKTDIAYQEFATVDSVTSVADELRQDVSWLTSDPVFTASVTEIVNNTISAACADGGIIKNLVDAAIQECKQYTDDQLSNISMPAMLSSVANLESIEEKGSNGSDSDGSIA